MRQRRKPSRFARILGWIRRATLYSVVGFLLVSLLLVVPFAWLQPPASSFILQSRWLAEPGDPPTRFQWVNYETIATEMALAVVAAEDQRFAQHYGFDFDAIERAWADYRQGKSLRGASTISQQVAKNLYLWPSRSFVRKGLEVWFTLLIELCWSKQRILETYLNIAQFGDYTFGVEAASQRFFNRPAQQLSRKQAALLAAVLPSPGRYRADAPSPQLRKRQAWILRQIRQLGGPAYIENL